jgi:hypothetical protein
MPERPVEGPQTDVDGASSRTLHVRTLIFLSVALALILLARQYHWFIPATYVLLGSAAGSCLLGCGSGLLTALQVARRRAVSTPCFLMVMSMGVWWWFEWRTLWPPTRS